MAYIVIKGDELYHHGIKGMKWGVRRYQNADGSLKAAGRKRYTEGGPKSLKGNLHRLAAKNYELNEKTYEKMGNKTLASMNRAAKENSLKKAEAADAEKAKRISEKKPLTDEERAARNAKIKKAAVAAGAVAATAALAYVGHKYVKHLDSETWDVVKKARDHAITDNFEMYEQERSRTKSAKEMSKLDWTRIDRNRFVKSISDEKDYRRDVAKTVAKNDLRYAKDRILRRNPNREDYRENSVLDATRNLHNRADARLLLKQYADREAERMKNRR